MTEPVRLAIVQKRGQITIPVELRRKLGITEGGVVALTETEEGILLSPRKALAMDALDRIGEILEEQGITLEELIASGRDIRGEIVQEYGLDAESEE
jgi:AbrB family looped-hinge helix DNA binding protein